MSKELHQFYIAINEWISAGLPEDPVHNPYGFSKHTGLCQNSYYFGKSQGYGLLLRMEIKNQLMDDFKEAGLHPIFPFNQLEEYGHRCERNTGTIFHNPLRLKWIQDHLPKESK